MYEIERHEVETLAGNLLGEILNEPDPLRRYHALTRQQALTDALVSEIKRLRGLALAEAVDAGSSQREVAEAAGLGNQQRVHQLIVASNARR